MDRVDELAKVIWDYMLLKQLPQKCDIIVVLCSSDPRTVDRGIELYKEGYGDYLLLSGGLGRFTKNTFEQPEADIYKAVAIQQGVSEEKILVENQSTNTGENIRFTHELLSQNGLQPKSLLLVQKPYMERRTYATFKKQWPYNHTQILVTSPQITYDDYFNETLPKEHVLNIMVGDLQRIKEYPKLGFQVEQEIPVKVWRAFGALVNMGYTKHLIK